MRRTWRSNGLFLWDSQVKEHHLQGKIIEVDRRANTWCKEATKSTHSSCGKEGKGGDTAASNGVIKSIGKWPALSPILANTIGLFSLLLSFRLGQGKQSFEDHAAAIRQFQQRHHQAHSQWKQGKARPQSKRQSSDSDSQKRKKQDLASAITQGIRIAITKEACNKRTLIYDCYFWCAIKRVSL